MPCGIVYAWTRWFFCSLFSVHLTVSADMDGIVHRIVEIQSSHRLTVCLSVCLPACLDRKSAILPHIHHCRFVITSEDQSTLPTLVVPVDALLLDILFPVTQGK
ncbi:hypothetical protein LY76DRAFT_184956 [Colletotrichum caudatum]|nr:hypothetical protein LY76DRAFT_184956 [Colletotrichum caudatum]